MAEDSLRNKKRATIHIMSDRELQEETLLELKIQNGLMRQDTHYLKRINQKVQVLFWIFVAYVIFATVMFLTGKV